jgi:hypothetical protein
MSEVALHDQNSVTTFLACLNTDTVQGTNLVRLEVNNSTGALLVDKTSTISFTMKPIDPRDTDYASVWAFQGTDGQLYPCVATSAGALLINKM